MESTPFAIQDLNYRTNFHLKQEISHLSGNLNSSFVLEDLDFADDYRCTDALLSSKFNDLHEKTGRLAEEAARVGLKLNARKCKTLRTECASRMEKVVVHGWRRSG